MLKAKETKDKMVQVQGVYTTKKGGEPLLAKGEPYIRVRVLPELEEGHDGYCSVFDSNFFDTFEVETWYTVTYTKTGNFYNIVDAVPTDAEKGRDTLVKKDKPATPLPDFNALKDKSIRIQWAGKCATWLVVGLVEAGVLTLDDIEFNVEKYTKSNIKMHDELLKEE
jgi:hypothetical protein